MVLLACRDDDIDATIDTFAYAILWFVKNKILFIVCYRTL